MFIVHAIALMLGVLALSAPGASADLVLPAGLVKASEPSLAPTTTFLDENGVPKTIESFRGKIVVLNFWATWCPPCVKEIPSLERLATRLPTASFAVVGISQDKGGMAVAKAFLLQHGAIKFPLYVDPKGQLYRDLGIRGLPTTIVIGKDGVVDSTFEGPAEWDKAEFITYFLSLSQSTTKALPE